MSGYVTTKRLCSCVRRSPNATGRSSRHSPRVRVATGAQLVSAALRRRHAAAGAARAGSPGRTAGSWRVCPGVIGGVRAGSAGPRVRPGRGRATVGRPGRREAARAALGRRSGVPGPLPGRHGALCATVAGRAGRAICGSCGSLGEPGVWRSFHGAGRGTGHAQAGCVRGRSTVDGFEDHWFLEVDLGTEWHAHARPQVQRLPGLLAVRHRAGQARRVPPRAVARARRAARRPAGRRHRPAARRCPVAVCGQPPRRRRDADAPGSRAMSGAAAQHHPDRRRRHDACQAARGERRLRHHVPAVLPAARLRHTRAARAGAERRRTGWRTCGRWPVRSPGSSSRAGPSGSTWATASPATSATARRRRGCCSPRNGWSRRWRQTAGWCATRSSGPSPTPCPHPSGTG